MERRGRHLDLENARFGRFFCRQARSLAETGQLALFFLDFKDRPIAFSYAWHSKGCHFCVKPGYDDAFRSYGPGQQLTMRLLEWMHENPRIDLVDFWGPSMPWSASWATRCYPEGRLIAATPGSLFGRTLVAAYDNCTPYLRRLRNAVRRRENVASEPVAAGASL